MHASSSPSSLVLSRRMFLGGMVAAAGMVLVGCTPEQLMSGDALTQTPVQPFFSGDERETVAAIVERLVPGSPEDPGAIEAGVVDYIDGKLAGFAAFAQPAFLSAPFVDVVPAGQAVPTQGALVVAADQLYRYGYQSGLLPQELYRRGLQNLNRFAEQQFGARFAELPEEQRDELLGALDEVQQNSEGSNEGAQGTASEGTSTSDSASSRLVAPAEESFGDMSSGEFFSTVRTDTLEGMFADPSYGGNKNLVGWKLIGYPGYQRAYSPEEMLRGTRRKTQPLSELPSMNPDRRHEREGALPALLQPLEGVQDG